MASMTHVHIEAAKHVGKQHVEFKQFSERNTKWQQTYIQTIPHTHTYTMGYDP